MFISIASIVTMLAELINCLTYCYRFINVTKLLAGLAKRYANVNKRL